MTKKVRVRFAPSPTGPLHMGGVRTALYNYLLAKKSADGVFVLRIEDTDQTRYVPGAEDYIHESLAWCGLIPDEGPRAGGDYGPYRQSERKAMYKQYADQLIENGYAYYAFDTLEEVDKMREDMKAQGVPAPQYNSVTRQYMKNSITLSADEVKTRLENGDPYVIRFKMPRNEEVKFEDTVRGWVTFNTSQLDDKVILKGDGMPTYHLANVVDDYLMKISHVIRGEEWLSSAPLHVMLYKGLGWEDSMPVFNHLPLILKPDGKGKLSKRDGDRLGIPVFPLDWEDPSSGEKSSGYRERGFFPEAFLNMLAFLGWNPGTAQELFTLPELVEAFTLERVGKAGAKFDYDKAKWFNQQYLKEKDDKTLLELVRPFLEKAGYTGHDEAYLLSFVGMMKERAVFLSDFPEIGYYFFEDIKQYEEKMIRKKWKQERIPLFDELVNQLKALDPFEPGAIETTVKSFMEANSLGFGDVLPILRLSVTGTMQGPPIFDIMALFGKEMVMERMAKSFVYFNEVAAKVAN